MYTCLFRERIFSFFASHKNLKLKINNVKIANELPNTTIPQFKWVRI